jgi:hypothetical protein
MRFFRFLTIAATLVALSVGAPRANALPILNLFNTGVDGGGALLPNNAVDTHWSVVSAPAGAPSGMTALAVAPPAANPFPIPPWVANLSNAEWISGPNPTGSGPINPVPNGQYDYQTTFTDQDGGAAAISGRLSADDQVVAIRINGVNALVTPVGTLPTPDQGYSALYAFTAIGGAGTGTNTLDIIVSNTHLAVEGLIVSIVSATTQAVTPTPEPASIVMLGSGVIGILGLAGLRRRMKKKVA